MQTAGEDDETRNLNTSGTRTAPHRTAPHRTASPRRRSKEKTEKEIREEKDGGPWPMTVPNLERKREFVTIELDRTEPTMARASLWLSCWRARHGCLNQHRKEGKRKKKDMSYLVVPHASCPNFNMRCELSTKKEVWSPLPPPLPPTHVHHSCLVLVHVCWSLTVGSMTSNLMINTAPSPPPFILTKEILSGCQMHTKLKVSRTFYFFARLPANIWNVPVAELSFYPILTD